MEPFFKQRETELSSTHFYLGNSLPAMSDFDWLVVMGGPMGVHDEIQFSWLKDEKTFIRDSIEAGKIVLGICLGAQLIADALGARVFKNEYREIGWFPIERKIAIDESALADVFPETCEVFHWHGDTFEIPAGGHLLAASEACANQGFILDDRVVGLQFHLETTFASATALIQNCRSELDGSQFVQSEEEMLADPSRFSMINRISNSLLDHLAKMLS